MNRAALIVGAAGVAASAVGFALAREQFFRSWLTACVFWMGPALGCTALLMIHHLAGGRWGFVSRRVLEAAARTTPLLAVFFLPLLLGLRDLYPWVDGHSKAAYLNLPFFLARAAGYFAAWIAVSTLLTRWSARQDTSGDPALARRMEGLSGPGLVVYGLTLTFAAIDWVMSLQPEWYSTVYGALFAVGHVLTGIAFAIVVLAALRPPAATDARFHDLGNLLLTFVLLWAYLNFAQFLIIWSGNLPEEISWYRSRGWSEWGWIAILLIVFHFAVPLFVLLSRRAKRSVGMLASVAAAVLAMRLVDAFWNVAPAFHPQDVRLHWLDLAAPLGIGGLWFAAFLRQLRRMPLLPQRDPCFKGEERSEG